LKWGEATGSGQMFVFAACSLAFLIASFAALGMNATKLVQKMEPEIN